MNQAELNRLPSEAKTIPADKIVRDRKPRVHTMKGIETIAPQVVVKNVDLVTYEGVEMTRAQAQNRQREAAKNHSASVGFDLLVTLDDLLVTPSLKSRVFSSMAWSIDMAVINAARSVFWDTHTQAVEDGHIDNFAEFLNRMSEIKANESYAEELGFELNSGRLAQISLLMKLSKNWHDKAQTVALSARLRYTPKSFEVLLASEKVEPVTALSRAKLMLNIDPEGMTDEEVEEHLDRLVEKAEMSNAQRHEARQKVTPAVLRILDYVSHHVYGENVTEFWQLPDAVQGRFIETSIKTVARASSDLALDRRTDVAEYAVILKESRAAGKSLNAELANPKYLPE